METGIIIQDSFLEAIMCNGEDFVLPTPCEDCDRLGCYACPFNEGENNG